MTPSKRTIAIVDDDPRLLESLENLFESAGYQVASFESGEALLTAGVEAVDCVITDIGMPLMNGFDLRDAIKTQRPALPVFLLTGRHEIGDQQRAARDDIAGFFRKPFDGKELLAAVDKVLNKRSEEDRQ